MDKPESVRRVLETLRGKVGSERLYFLLRSTTASASSEDVRRTREQLAALREELVKLQQAYNTKAQHCMLVDAAVYDVSEKHKEELDKDITRRIGNRLRLEKESAQKEALFAFTGTNRQNALQNKAEVQSVLARLQLEIRHDQESLQAERRVINDLKKLRSDATQANQLLAAREAERYHKELASAKTALDEKQNEFQQLRTHYEDQAAGFSQQDFSKFLTEKRAKHHPTKLAIAIAGLPEIGCRDSVTRCKRLSGFPEEPHTNFQTFDVIARAWAKRKASKPKPLIDLIQQQLSKVPKNRSYNGTREKETCGHFRDSARSTKIY